MNMRNAYKLSTVMAKSKMLKEAKNDEISQFSCRQLSSIVIKCHQMSPNVTKCHQMSPNVVNCHQLSLIAK